MTRKEMLEQGWAQVQTEARILSNPDLQTHDEPQTHERIVDLACKNIILGSYRDG